MNLMHLILILATFIPTIVYSARYNNDFESNWQELLLQSRAAVKLNADCNWISYDQESYDRIVTNDKSYQCADKTVVGGYCVLPWSQAVTLCNSDINCGGFSITTNLNWHNAYDTNGESSVQLFSTTTPFMLSSNKEWYSLSKKCWNFNT